LHDSAVAVDTGAAGLLALVGDLADVERRPETAAALARLLGGERLLLFAPDPELGVVLPAPGFPQVLRGAAGWRAFIEASVREGELSGTVPGVDGPEPACGCALADGTAAVLVRPAPGAPGPGLLRPLLPLLSSCFRAERQVIADEVRLRAAREAAERERALTQTLRQLRDRLEDALAEAQEARTQARKRAEEAEALATELQAHAELLQDQAMELEASNDELAARTEEAERARVDADRARAEADEANRAKSSFLANMSHELRTPINAVIGYAELLDMGVTGPVTPEQQAQLERIRASSAHLLTLINDILDLAKVEAGHMTVQHVREPVAEVVAEALALVGLQAEARALTLENECRESRAVYVGDQDRVRQILVNLLSNAVKFTAAGGRVTIRCATTDQPEPRAQLAGAGPWTRLSVEDTGIGIAAEQLPRIFQPFIQAEEGHTRTKGGTGLGLTISRQLARLMGGDLTVTSSEGNGSCFVLWLPAVTPETGSLDSTIRVGARTTHRRAGRPRTRPDANDDGSDEDSVADR
jgi:signal transduction histidine kinase